MPNKPIPRYKKSLIFKMTLGRKGIGEISRKTRLSRKTVKKYQEILESIVKSEVDRVTKPPSPDQSN